MKLIIKVMFCLGFLNSFMLGLFAQSYKPELIIQKTDDYEYITKAAFSADGKYLVTYSVTGDSSEVVDLWFANDGKRLANSEIICGGDGRENDGKDILCGSMTSFMSVSKSGEKLFVPFNTLLWGFEKNKNTYFSPSIKFNVDKLVWTRKKDPID